MQDLEAILARLDRMESTKAVADVVYGYAHAVSKADAAAVAALFTEDGAFIVIETGEDGAPKVRNDLRGPEALKAFYSATLKPGEIYPLVSDLVVEVDGDTARGACFMGGAAADGTPRFFGAYVDTFRREGGRWRFSSRTFTIASRRG
jgi:ketosteroid isomerase-like protein